MEERASTFENLVATLSKEETKRLLDNIKSSMQNIQDEVQREDSVEKESEPKEASSIDISKESIFLRLWLKLISIIKSVPVESLYQKELVKRIGFSLREAATEYIDISKKIYTTQFYNLLSSLRKTQVFFSGVLDSYNSEKNTFYMLLLTFVSNSFYKKLLDTSSSFANDANDTSNQRKNAILKDIERVIADIDIDVKTQMYQTSQAIEWMRTFCDFSLDKVLLKFTVQGEETTCSIVAIQNEIELLSSILASSKTIPVPLLQTLLLLQQKDSLPIDTQNGGDLQDYTKKTDQFVSEALISLSSIQEFKTKVPFRQIVRYVKQDITWMPIEFKGGEDWFLYFKHAWRDFFLQKWAEWNVNIQKSNITSKMLGLVGKKSLEVLLYKPWRAILGSVILKNETLVEFFKTFFKTTYTEQIAPNLKIVLNEGSFYRSDTLSEFTSYYTALSLVTKEIEDFEKELSPESVIGSSFASIVESGVLTIKTKAQMENLVKNIEGDMKRIVDRILENVKSVHAILLSIIGEERGAGNVKLTNLSSIQGANNKQFQKEIGRTKDILSEIISIVEQVSYLSSNL